MKNIDSKERLIVALDMPSVKEAKDLVDLLGDTVVFYKVGIILHSTYEGSEFIKWLKDKKKKVFLDLKFFDIEDTVRRAVISVAKLGVDFLTIHGGCEKILNFAVEGKADTSLKILAVTVLTSFGPEELKKYGIIQPLEKIVLERAKMAYRCKCDGVIASGNEVHLIRKETGPDFLIVTPGIRPLDSAVDCHKRVTTPYQAIKAGSDYLVVGRPVIEAKEPCELVKKIISEIETALKEK